MTTKSKRKDACFLRAVQGKGTKVPKRRSPLLPPPTSPPALLPGARRSAVACGEAGRAEAPWEPAHHIPAVGSQTRAPRQLRLAPGEVRARLQLGLRRGGDGSHSALPGSRETAGPFRRRPPLGIPAQDPGRWPRARPSGQRGDDSL